MNKNLTTFLLSITLLSGCAMVGPDYRAPTPGSPAAWFQAVSSKDVARAEAAGDLSRWWRAFNDPLLSELVEQSLQSSPDVRSAQARLRESRARRAIAGAGLFPSVSASADARRSKSSEETGGGTARNSFSASFDASWELDVFGGTRRGIEAADADLESSEASLHDTQVSLVA